MNRKFGIQNFRVFDEEGAQFKLAPITVLTGCNSSGKSSLIKSLMLFEDFFKRLKTDYKSENLTDVLSYPLKLNEGEHKLAKFKNTLNKNSESDEMVFSFTRHSLFADSEIDVEFVFKGNESILGNGFLDKLRIKYEDKYIYVYSFNFSKEKNRLHIDHKSFIDLYFNFLRKISDNEKFYIDFNSNVSQFSNETFRYNPLYKGLSNVNVETKNLRDNLAYLYLKNSSDDKNEKLISYFKKLEDKDLTSRTLFGSPAYEYLKDATKENINELISDKITNDEKVHDNIKNDKESISKQLGFIADLFVKSGHTYFKDYFAELENNYFSEKYTNEIISKDKFNTAVFGAKHSTVSMNFLSSTKNALTLYKVGPFGFNTRFSLNNLGNDRAFTSFEELCVTMFGFSEFVAPGHYEKDENTKYYEDHDFDGESMIFNYEEYMAVNDQEKWIEYVNYFLDDAFFNLPDYIDNVEFVNSNRPKVERFYDLSNLSGSFAHLIKGYVSYDGKVILIKGKEKYIPGDFLRKWVTELEIADDVIFESTIEGSGIFIYLLNNGEKTLLADLGYGITQVLSMLLKIELSILSNFEKIDKSLILGEMINPFEYENKEQTITIEEPEANLHPKLQSKLANMFMEANELYNINFIIETHSEYLIRKLQYLVALKKLETENVIVYYLNNPVSGKRSDNSPHVVEITINEDGSLDGDFGTGFFDEATNWKFELMRLKNTQKN